MSAVEETPIAPLFMLPSELLASILHDLDYISLLNCTETCTVLRDLVTTTTSLQCVIQMATLGLESSNSALIPMDMMEKLNERRRIWDALDWSSYSTINVIGSCQAYELVGGVFAQSDGFNITFHWLPSRTSSGHLIKCKTLVPLRDFAMDPSQDLLVILEQNDIYSASDETNTVLIHLRALTTHLPHEEAVSARFAFPFPPDSPNGNGVVGAALYIMHDFLSINLRIGSWQESKCRIVVFNWKTSVVVYDSDESKLTHGFEDFELLGDSTFIMASHDGSGSLLLYSLDHERPGPLLCCALNLPSLSEGSSLQSSVIFHDPCVAKHMSSDGNPFAPALDDALVILSLSYHLYHEECTSCGGSRYEYTLIIPTRVLLRYAKKHRIVNVPELSDRVVKAYAWDEWGPHSTRLLHPCIPKGWLRFSSGQQIIISTCSDDAASSTQPIQILDFSRHPEPKMSTDETTILRIGRDSPTYILRPSPFEEDVLTYLPYHRLIRTSLEPCRLFMMDEHRIIGVTLEDDNGEASTKLQVYTF
ncbi:hypothetical protein BJ165DRAFT_1478651 [Panaeolus papilionaceus]|nr:hypothetical protein BJ165DRAFT_1478651 [Panaeolus papilionaceus]